MSYNPGTGPYNNPQETITSPLQSTPQQLSTADGTIQGNIDGRNNVLFWQVFFPYFQAFRNGVLLTCGVDYGAGQTAIAFFPGAVPQVGDIVTILGYGSV